MESERHTERRKFHLPLIFKQYNRKYLSFIALNKLAIIQHYNVTKSPLQVSNKAELTSPRRRLSVKSRQVVDLPRQTVRQEQRDNSTWISVCGEKSAEAVKKK